MLSEIFMEEKKKDWINVYVIELEDKFLQDF